MGAAILSCPKLEIDAAEAEKLSAAMAAVAREYAVEVDPRKLAIYNLFAACGVIYGPRIMAWRIERKMRAPAAIPVPAPAPRQPAEAEPPRQAPAPPPHQHAPSEIWQEPAADFPGMG